MAKLRKIMDAEDGIGLTEVMVAMFLLTVVALSLLPLLITGMKLATTNTTIAAATALTNDRIRVAQGAAPSCTGVVSAVNGVLETTDERGVELRATTSVVGTCPGAGTAATLKVTTTVIRIDSGDELAKASTLVLVTP